VCARLCVFCCCLFACVCVLRECIVCASACSCLCVCVCAGMCKIVCVVCVLGRAARFFLSPVHAVELTHGQHNTRNTQRSAHSHKVQTRFTNTQTQTHKHTTKQPNTRTFCKKQLLNNNNKPFQRVCLTIMCRFCGCDCCCCCFFCCCCCCCCCG